MNFENVRLYYVVSKERTLHKIDGSWNHPKSSNVMVKSFFCY